MLALLAVVAGELAALHNRTVTTPSETTVRDAFPDPFDASGGAVPHTHPRFS
jgi:hypothetical protein